MQNAATDPILAHVVSGRDVRIEGSAASERLDAVAAGLDGGFNVVRLTAPAGGLSLSALIAQLSGREKFDDQDDAALEAGLRRLSGADAPGRRTVLLLDATHGVQRPVLRYLQQVGRTAPNLTLVIAGFAELASYLESPDMARLRDRLVVATAEPADQPVPGRALMVVPSAVKQAPAPVVPEPDAWTLQARRRAWLRKQRRSRRVALMWTTSALAMMTSVAVGAWLGQVRAPLEAAAVVATRHAELTLEPVPANLVLPPLADRVTPLPATVPTRPRGAPSPAPALAKSLAPDPVASGEPPSAVSAKPEAVTFAAVEERLASMAQPRASEARRPAASPVRPHVAARAKAPSTAPAEAPRYAEQERPMPYYGAAALPQEESVPIPRRPQTRFAREPVGAEYDPYGQEAARRYGEPDPRSARYEPPGEAGYIGTYSTGPYGGRMFRYDP